MQLLWPGPSQRAGSRGGLAPGGPVRGRAAGRSAVAAGPRSRPRAGRRDRYRAWGRDLRHWYRGWAGTVALVPRPEGAPRHRYRARPPVSLTASYVACWQDAIAAFLAGGQWCPRSIRAFGRSLTSLPPTSRARP